tara:strand:- start:751 stop:1209 length:459 start_codon:yes stop_codon:yes gene_type:complete
MDLTQEGIGEIQISEPGIKPGRYEMEYFNEEIVTSKNNEAYKGLRITFRINDSGELVSHLFALAGDETSVSLSQENLGLLSYAAGVFPTLKDTEQLKGKKISAEVHVNKNGYTEVKAKSWQKLEADDEAAETQTDKPKEKEGEGLVDDEIPF